MIVNQTAVTEADQEILRAILRRQPLVIAARIFVALFALYLLTAAGLTAYAEIRWHKQSTFDLVFSAIFLVLGVWFLYRDLFLKQTTRSKDRKAASISVPRCYTLDDTGITVQHSANGVDATAKYAYHNAECFWTANNAVFICVTGQEKKQKRYMVLHDDSYSAGSRTELLALLERKGVRHIQK
ncbi:MAG: hypothetical protein J6P20_02040 [Oscillospiraceae bacterium]|nr:hypothetical protein [Oscillospiraceae bacterium]